MAEQNVPQLVKGEYLMYKDKPLVREGNTICYGDKTEKCILILEIMKYKEVDGHKVPDSILIQVNTYAETLGLPQLVLQGGNKKTQKLKIEVLRG